MIEWISIEKNLPKIKEGDVFGKEVLIIDDNLFIFCGYYHIDKDGKQTWLTYKGNILKLSKITHWATITLPSDDQEINTIKWIDVKKEKPDVCNSLLISDGYCVYPCISVLLTKHIDGNKLHDYVGYKNENFPICDNDHVTHWATINYPE